MPRILGVTVCGPSLAQQVLKKEEKHSIWSAIATFLHLQAGSLRTQLSSLSPTATLKSRQVQTFIQTVTAEVKAIRPQATTKEIMRAVTELLASRSDMRALIKEINPVSPLSQYGRPIAFTLTASTLAGVAYALSSGPLPLADNSGSVNDSSIPVETSLFSPMSTYVTVAVVAALVAAAYFTCKRPSSSPVLKERREELPERTEKPIEPRVIRKEEGSIKPRVIGKEVVTPSVPKGDWKDEGRKLVDGISYWDNGVEVAFLKRWLDAGNSDGTYSERLNLLIEVLEQKDRDETGWLGGILDFLSDQKDFRNKPIPIETVMGELLHQKQLWKEDKNKIDVRREVSYGSIPKEMQDRWGLERSYRSLEMMVSHFLEIKNRLYLADTLVGLMQRAGRKEFAPSAE